MKKLFILLCLIAVAISGCARATPTEKPADNTPIVTAPVVSPTTEPAATVPYQTPSQDDIENAAERFKSLGYAIRFDSETQDKPDENGFEMPYTDITVVLLRNGTETGFKPQVKDMIGGVMSEWYDDPEYVATIYQPPGSYIAATSVYYAGAGDEIFVSYNAADNVLTVWHRVFYEGGPDDAIEDLYEPWEVVATVDIS